MRWAFLVDGKPVLATDRFARLSEPGKLRERLLPLALGWQRALTPGTRVLFCHLETCAPEVWRDPETDAAPERDVWNAAAGLVVEGDDAGMTRLSLATGAGDDDTEDWFPSACIFAGKLAIDAWVRLEQQDWPKHPDRVRAAVRNDRRLVLTSDDTLGPICYWRL